MSDTTSIDIPHIKANAVIHVDYDSRFITQLQSALDVLSATFTTAQLEGINTKVRDRKALDTYEMVLAVLTRVNIHIFEAAKVQDAVEYRPLM